jgi:hypothetical protein
MRLRHLVILLAACGGGSSKKNPDAPAADASPDAYICTPTNVTLGTQQFVGYDMQNKIITWAETVTPMLDGDTYQLQNQFYQLGVSLQGTFDLTMGDQANFKTCEACFLMVSSMTDMMGNPLHTYYQSGGTLTLGEDPFTNQKMMGSVTNLALDEVTINWGGDFSSTPVPGGKCVLVGNVTLMADNVPPGWTCDHAKYNDGTMCDCMCGIQDPDCDNHSHANNCTPSTDACFGGMCVVPPANDTCALATPPLVVNAAATNGTTVGANDDYNMGLDSATCINMEPQPGYDVAYSVALTEGLSYTITLTNLDTTMSFDPSLALVGPGAATVCSANITTCVAGVDVGLGGGNETLTYTVPTGGTGTYYIIVDSFALGDAGAFTIAVTQP